MYFRIFYEYTDEIGGDNIQLVTRSVTKALTLEWEMVRKWIVRSVLNGPRYGESNRKVRMGPERMRVGIRSWRKIYIPHLLLVTLFGEGYKKFGRLEQRDFGCGGGGNGGRRVFHIGSQQRIVELLTINKWCAVEVAGEVGRRTCCGRVNVVRVDGGRKLNQVGYVLDESVLNLHCMLENKQLVWLPKPKWDKLNGYVYLKPNN